MHKFVVTERLSKKRGEFRRGFTLLELVVVVKILGVVSAVAAPKMFDTAKDAKDNTLRQTLLSVRDVIEVYKSQHGSYPGEAGTEADFKADMAPYFQVFPCNPLKATQTKTNVYSAGTPLSFVSGSPGWLYDNVTGEFIANSNGIHAETGLRYDQL